MPREEQLEGHALKNDVKFWLSIGLGLAGLAAISGMVMQYYQNQRTRLEVDPRADQVRELLHEAEQLLAVGRGGGRGAFLRRAGA